uniref:6,7-dimethyl-8-ribityllumazine synthase n=2 Tax=Candidatus Bipolaricaulota TaxID=67810 RepID=H5SJU8_9BACT|nr:riboflavin synthase beta chain [uncultured Acetothermia bacterium]BAL59516.1 riboflavin synthase beta chain [Candidatus Acetothermum autotrophicum]
MSLKIAVVVSQFNREITQEMLKAAQEELRRSGVSEIEVFWVPGAFEIPATVKRLAQSGRYDGILPLGCVIKGETAHFEHIARVVTDALMRLTLECETPIVFGVLTPYTEEQAWARVSKGAEVAKSLLELITLRRRLS